MLRKLRYDIDYPPIESGAKTRPDYLARNAQLQFYVECTTANISVTEHKKKKLQSQIYDAVDKLKLPKGHALYIELLVHGTGSPPLTKITKAVHEWTAITEPGDEPGKVEHVVRMGNWALNVSLYLDNSRQRPGAIDMERPHLATRVPELAIATALETKAKHYGRQLGMPYVIAVMDVVDEYCLYHPEDAITGVVFGREVTRWNWHNEARCHHAFETSGLWARRDKTCRNQQVSAVLLFPGRSLSHLRRFDHQPILAINPKAVHPLSDAALPLARLAMQEGEWKIVAGRSIADILELPRNWDVYR